MTEDTVGGGVATPAESMLTVEVGGGLTVLCEGAVTVVAGADKNVDLFVGRGEDFVVGDEPARVGGFPTVGAGVAAAALVVEPKATGEAELCLSD